MIGHKRMKVAVSVATVWTSPDSPRPLDEPALQHPVDIAGWLKAMTIPDKLDIYEANRVQTQVLYGTVVLETEESGDWVKVFIPDQSTPNNPLGYPGWVPKRQLIDAKEDTAVEKWVEVTSAGAPLSLPSSNDRIELSFLTRLPLMKETDEGVTLDTPDGLALLKREDVRIVSSSETTSPAEGNMGMRIVEQAKRFIGLPYLWGGLSSFGYDCSGFAHSMLKSQGILIPRDASAQSQQGQFIETDRLEPGDLLFFAFEEGKGNVHHVGIYAGGNRMIHSPNSKSCIEVVELQVYELAKEHCVSRRYWT